MTSIISEKLSGFVPFVLQNGYKKYKQILSSINNIEKYSIFLITKIKVADIYDTDYISINNNKIKFSNFLKKINNDINIPTNDIELIVNLFKCYVLYNDNKLKFKILEGKSLLEGYSTKNYIDKVSSLGNSCMNDQFNFLELYTKNPDVIKLLVLVDNNDKIYGRCLLWKVSKNKYFLDKKYTINNDLFVLFFNYYAIKNKYYYHHKHVIKFNNKKVRKRFKVQINFDDIDKVPYLDTMYYLTIKSYIFSNKVTLSNVILPFSYYYYCQYIDGYLDKLAHNLF